MAAVSWQESLNLARSEQDVVKVVRDFVAGLNLYELDKLPSPCRPPGKFFDAEDITSYAFEVVRHHCDDDEPTRELVHKIATFFSYASTRLSQLMARAADPDEEEARSA